MEYMVLKAFVGCWI